MLLYAPTFRKQAEGSMPEVDWPLVSKVLDALGLKMVVMRHPNTPEPIVGCEYENMIELDGTMQSSVEIVKHCSALITDYSSVMADAWAAGKPVVLLNREDGYLDKRGMYFKYPDGYSSLSASAMELAVEKAAWAISNKLTASDTSRFYRECMGECNGKATERVVGFIKGLL